MSEELPEEARRTRRRLRRRSAVDATPPPDPKAWRTVGVVAGAAAVLVIVGLLVPVPTSEAEQSGAVEPVDSSVAVCPEPGSIDGSRTTSAMTVIPDLPGQDRSGEAAIGYLEGDEATDEAVAAAEVQGTLTAPGDTAQVVAEDARLPALQVRTVGGLAPGLVAAQTTQDSFTRGRGLSSQPCLGPDTTWWFVGGGSTAGRESELVLVNPEDTPADLEVAISGPDGLVSTPQLKGIVVEPRSRVVVQMSREAPRVSAAAWRVTVRQGRVMAALFDKEAEGFVPRGADWVPASADPSTRVLIPGISGGAGSRQLLVHAPGDLTATVRVRLITTGGSFVPEAAPEIEVPGGSVVSVDLEDALQGEIATIDLQSDEPIVAGVRQRHPGIGASAGSLEETSFATGAVGITSQAAVTGLPAERGTSVTVWVTAPDDIVTVTPMSEDQMSEDPMSEDQMSDAPMSDAPMSEDQMSDAPTSASAGATSAPADAPIDAQADSSAAPVSVTLRIVAVSPEGEALQSVADITVSVPRGRLTPIEVPRPEGAAWYTAVATVTGGEVVIAHQSLRRNKDGALITGYPWRPLRTSVVVPRAVPDPRLAVSGS